MITLIKSTLLILIIGNVVQSQRHLFPAERNFLLKCFQNQSQFDRFKRPSHSIENLITIIEKIEEQEFFKDKTPEQIAGYLTVRFREDGIFKGPSAEFATEEDIKIKNKFLTKIIKTFRTEDYIKWRIEFLTDNDQCALHWMLSSTINMTFRATEDRDHSVPTSKDVTNDYFKQVPQDIRTRRPLEDGVIATKFGTVSAGNLLMGIALSDLKPGAEMFIYQVLPDTTDDRIRNVKVPILASATLGVDLALASKNDAPNSKPDVLGPKGTWNCSYCPSEYQLETFATFGTYAEVLGGLDGYILGKALKPLSEGRSLRLSHILRMYYGEGFAKNPELRACNRLKTLRNLVDGTTELKNSIEVMNFVIEDGRGALDDSEAEVNRVISTLRTNFTKKNLDIPESCKETETFNYWTVELRLDILIVLDGNDFQVYEQFEGQANLVGNTIQLLDVSENANHVGVYINKISLFEALYPLNYTQSKVELQCGLKRKDPETLMAYDTSNLFDIIAKTKSLLKRMKEEQDKRQIIGAPGKVLIFLWNQNAPDEERIRRDMEAFSRDLPEVTVILVGRTKIKYFVKDDTQDYVPFQQGSLMIDEARLLHERLKRVPIEINIPKCDKLDRQEKSSQFDWFISPNARQNLMIHSQMFNISKNLRIIVKSYNGAVTVCRFRDSSLINRVPVDLKKGDCARLEANGNKIFTFSDPCAVNRYYCPPIYLQIEANSTAPVSPCLDQECRTFDQIKYNIAVENAYCAGVLWKATNVILFFSIAFSILMR